MSPVAGPESAADGNQARVDAASPPAISESNLQSRPTAAGFVFASFSFLVVWTLFPAPVFLLHFSQHQSLASIHQPFEIKVRNLIQ